MSAVTTNNIKTSQPATPRGLKQFLVVLLILTAICGYALHVVLFTSGAYVAFQSPLEALAPFTKILQEKTTSLLDTTLSNSKTETTIWFQGTMRVKQGTVAIVNDNRITEGATISGIQIVKITDRELTVKYGDQTQTIGFGQRVSIWH
jgi:hypothetical protein